MKRIAFTILLVAGIAGCTDAMNASRSTANEGQPRTNPDNTAVNVRDRDDAAKTPIDQNENQSDIDITARIREQVVDTDLSVNAQNVKIITQGGKVTLRGPVNSDGEKKKVEEIALAIAGTGKVDNQLEVKSP